MTAIRRILVINGHPDLNAIHFGHALADAYIDGARSGGHEYRRLDLARLDFPFLRSKEDWENGPLPAGLVAAADLIAWADHLVLVFPLWLGTMPALVKAFLEHVLHPLHGGSRGIDLLPTERLAGKSVRIVVTMGMPAAWYRFFYRAHGLRGLERNILRFCGASPVRSTLIGLVEGSAARRARALARVRGLGVRAR